MIIIGIFGVLKLCKAVTVKEDDTVGLRSDMAALKKNIDHLESVIRDLKKECIDNSKANINTHNFKLNRNQIDCIYSAEFERIYKSAADKAGALYILFGGMKKDITSIENKMIHDGYSNAEIICLKNQAKSKAAIS